jgi:hypothetical protein
MPLPPDPRPARARRRLRATLRALLAALAAAGAGGAAVAQSEADATYRHEAPIRIETAAPVLRLAVPAPVLARSASPRHADLRIVDATGARVPFARLPAERRERADERSRDAVPYPLPARPSPDGTWPLPIAIAVDGDRIRVRRGGPPPSEPPGRSAGWLVDTGPRTAETPAAESLVVAWSGPAEFTAGYRLQTSDDLRAWRDGEPGQLLQLASPAGTLVQATVPLPAPAQRYARLVWTDPAAPVPTVTGIRAVAPVRVADGTSAPSAEVAVPARAVAADTAAGLSEEDARRTLVFDFDGPLPVDAVRLRLPTGEARLLPVRIDGRESTRVAWRPLGTAVFRTGPEGGETPESRLQAFAGGGSGLPLRQIRLVVDPRVAMPAAAGVALDARLALPELVFAPTGTPPFRLQTGNATASDGALPLAMLVPERHVDRARLGRASVGPVAENAEAARAADRADRLAAVRPWALWALLLVGVAALAAMVWRLAKAPRPIEGATTGPTDAA